MCIATELKDVVTVTDSAIYGREFDNMKRAFSKSAKNNKQYAEQTKRRNFCAAVALGILEPEQTVSGRRSLSQTSIEAFHGNRSSGGSSF